MLIISFPREATLFRIELLLIISCLDIKHVFACEILHLLKSNNRVHYREFIYIVL